MNELMLRSDGTVAGEAVPVLLLPPQAITTSPAAISAGTNLANLNVALSSSKRFLFAFFPADSGARVRRQAGLYSAALAAFRRVQRLLDPDGLSRVR